MTRILVAMAALVCWGAALAQRPADPALMIPESAPALDYAAVEHPLMLPPGMVPGAPASLRFTHDGHLLILYRGAQPFVEVDAGGRFVRAFGDGLLERAHGLKFDAAGNIWATDVRAHVVYKLSPRGQVLMTLGEKGRAGLISEPNDVAFGHNGDVFVVQGHTPGATAGPSVVKFDKNGKFIASWGKKGKGPGQFDVAHGIAVDASGRLWIADRENQRIQIWDQAGTHIKDLKYAGLPCSIQIGTRYINMVNGYGGQVLRLDLHGKVLAAAGKSGKGVGEFGEAHSVAVSASGDIWVADPSNGVVQKFVRK